MPPPEDEQRPPESRGYGQGYAYFGMALNFTIAILLFGAAGWAVDGWLGTRPLFAVIGAFGGGVLGFLSIYYRVRKETAEEGERRRRGTP